MIIFKKLFTRKRYINILGALLATWFIVSYYKLDPLDISLNSPTQKLRNYVKPDKVLVISFWASWCPHCRSEIAMLKRFKEKHPEIEILGVKVDDDSAETIFKDTGYPSLDASIHGSHIMQLLGNYTASLPFTVILNNDKRKKLLGETSSEELEKNISALQKVIHKS
jgi:thiol-disulfide isomerase/thioredoxin